MNFVKKKISEIVIPSDYLMLRPLNKNRINFFLTKEDFPPIIIGLHEGNFILIDGFSRLESFKKKGLTFIYCNQIQVTNYVEDFYIKNFLLNEYDINSLSFQSKNKDFLVKTLHSFDRKKFKINELRKKTGIELDFAAKSLGANKETIKKKFERETFLKKLFFLHNQNLSFYNIGKILNISAVYASQVVKKNLPNINNNFPINDMLNKEYTVFLENNSIEERFYDKNSTYYSEEVLFKEIKNLNCDLKNKNQTYDSPDVTKLIDIQEIQVVPELTKIRGVNDQRIKFLREKNFTYLKVTQINGQYYLLDGLQRLTIYRKNNIKKVNVVVYSNYGMNNKAHILKKHYEINKKNINSLPYTQDQNLKLLKFLKLNSKDTILNIFKQTQIPAILFEEIYGIEKSEKIKKKEEELNQLYSFKKNKDKIITIANKVNKHSSYISNIFKEYKFDPFEKSFDDTDTLNKEYLSFQNKDVQHKPKDQPKLPAKSTFIKNENKNLKRLSASPEYTNFYSNFSFMDSYKEKKINKIFLSCLYNINNKTSISITKMSEELETSTFIIFYNYLCMLCIISEKSNEDEINITQVKKIIDEYIDKTFINDVVNLFPQYLPSEGIILQYLKKNIDKINTTNSIIKQFLRKKFLFHIQKQQTNMLLNSDNSMKNKGLKNCELNNTIVFLNQSEQSFEQLKLFLLKNNIETTQKERLLNLLLNIQNNVSSIIADFVKKEILTNQKDI